MYHVISKRPFHLRKKFEKRSIDLNNLISQYKSIHDKSGNGFKLKEEVCEVESSIGQEIKSLEGKIAEHKFDINKLHGPLNKVQRLVVAMEKECD